MVDSNTDNILDYVDDSGHFSFRKELNTEMRTLNQCTLVSECKRIKLFLNGIVYNHNKKQLISGFVNDGVDYVKRLEGSFVIFLLDRSYFYIITDKVNSHKAFYALVNGTCFVSTNIDDIPKDNFKLSVDGIASYLSNGVMLNDLTLFHEIKCAKRASIHCLKDGNITVRRYWDYDFSYLSSDLYNEEENQNELQRLLIGSIKRRYSATKHRIALSLSAGYDARGILGILYKHLQANNISSLSYSLDDIPEFYSDAALAKKLAEKVGYDHTIIKSYNGDLISHLVSNAIVGKCIANFCDELDAWQSLSRKNFSDIFFGDECFGWVDVELQTKEEILHSVEIRGSNSIASLENILSPKTYIDIVDSINNLIDCIYESTSNIEEPHDKKDFLYLDQRINHLIMPWREYFSSKAGFVINPYLDGDILNFMKKLPPCLRRGKYLYKRTIEAMFPDLFSIPLAKSSGYVVDWPKEIRKNKNRLIELVSDQESRLDEIISSEEIIAIINSICFSKESSKKNQSFTERVFNYYTNKKRSFIKMVGRTERSRVPAGGQRVSPFKLLIRLLVMRIYLSDYSEMCKEQMLK